MKKIELDERLLWVLRYVADSDCECGGGNCVVCAARSLMIENLIEMQPYSQLRPHWAPPYQRKETIGA